MDFGTKGTEWISDLSTKGAKCGSSPVPSVASHKPINNDEQVLQSPFSIEFAWVKLFGFGH
jgi:hypothetical protein